VIVFYRLIPSPNQEIEYPTLEAASQNKYLDLLKRVLTAYYFPESSDTPIAAPKSGRSPRAILKRAIMKFAAARGIRLVKVSKFDVTARAEGRDWPSIAYTMVGLKRLDNVQYAIETIIQEKIRGDLIECGVWRGGTVIFMRAALREYDDNTRTVWAADSFSGMPKPDIIHYPADRSPTADQSQFDYLSVPLEKVQENIRAFGMLDERVRFIKGWFKDTLPCAPIKQLAILRADGDLYQSTMDILTNLYDKVSPGGFVIIDDYNAWGECNLAVNDFRASRGIVAPLETIDWSAVYWRVPMKDGRT
jgi:O-methyltransferase